MCMAALSKEFKQVCEASPNQRRWVIITLREEAASLSASDLGLTAGENIGDLGIIKAELSGKEVVDVSRKEEVEEIVPDMRVDML